MNGFRAAFEAVGYKSCDERLCDIAIAVLTNHARDWHSSKAHEELFAAVQNDAGLLWKLFEPFRTAAADRLLREIALDARHNQAARQNDRQQPSAAASSGSGQRAVEDQTNYARPAATPQPKPRVAPRDPIASAKNKAAIVTLSLLNTFKIELKGVNGTEVIAIGDCRASEANSWAASRERDAKFVRLLTANIPDDYPIRRYRSADVVAGMWAEANRHAA